MDVYLKKTGDPLQQGEAAWDTYRHMRKEIFSFPDWQTQGTVVAPGAPPQSEPEPNPDRHGGMTSIFR